MTAFRLGCVAAVSFVPISLAGCLQSSEKGFFGDFARTAIAGVGNALLTQQPVSLSGIAQSALSSALGMPTATTPQPVAPPAPSLNLPELDEKKARVIDTKERLLRQRLEKAAALKEKITADLEYMKEKAFEHYEAPVIFLEPPPITPKQELDAAETAEATLSLAGDETSPVMKAVKDYNEAKMGAITANTLEEVRRAIKQVESNIKKRKLEREELYDKLKAKGREIAKTGSKRIRKETEFINNDIKEKDKELDMLAEKLLKLKKKEAALIRTGGGAAQGAAEGEEGGAEGEEGGAEGEEGETEGGEREQTETQEEEAGDEGEY